MEERYIASVDLGTSRIALAVAKVSGADIQVIYYRTRPSEGIRYSAVFNPQKVSNILSAMIEDAEGELGLKISQVATGLPRNNVRQESASGKVVRSESDSSITKEEIDSIKMMAIDSYPVSDEKKEIIYGAVAQSFSTEDEFQALENDIVGMTGESLEGNFKVFIGNKRNVSNIDSALTKCGIASRKFFVPDVIARVVLTREEMENGVALIDMGAGATSLSIYENNILRHYISIPFGGNNITSDIKKECGISTELAENIKLGYGICMPEKLQNMSEKVLQLNYSDGRSSRLPVKYLSEIITARVREILDAMLYEIKASGYADKLRNGIVITGGSAELANLTLYIGEVSGYEVRRGYPRHYFSAEGCPGIFDTEASATAGMLLAAKASPYFNSVIQEDVPVKPAEKVTETVTVEEPAAVEEAEDKPQTTTVEKDHGFTPFGIEPTIFDDSEIEKKTKVKKVKRERPKLKTPLFWTKMSQKVENVLGGLYDQTENE